MFDKNEMYVDLPVSGEYLCYQHTKIIILTSMCIYFRAHFIHCIFFFFFFFFAIMMVGSFIDIVKSHLAKKDQPVFPSTPPQQFRNGPKFSDRYAWANSADPDQGLCCLPFSLHRLDSLLYGRAT